MVTRLPARTSTTWSRLSLEVSCRHKGARVIGVRAPWGGRRGSRGFEPVYGYVGVGLRVAHERAQAGPRGLDVRVVERVLEGAVALPEDKVDVAHGRLRPVGDLACGMGEGEGEGEGEDEGEGEGEGDGEAEGEGEGEGEGDSESEGNIEGDGDGDGEGALPRGRSATSPLESVVPARVEFSHGRR